MVPIHPEPPLWAWLLFGAFEFAIRIIALGIVPKHRRASTSTAWLLLIFLWPMLGVPLYFIFGSWWAMGRRLDDDPEARELVDNIVAGSTAPEPESYEAPDGPDGLPAGSDDDTASIMRLAGNLSGFPASVGRVGRLYNDTAETFRAMAASIDAATHHVNALYYQTSWDEYTAPFYEALARAKARGVTVRFLVDHHGMRTIPGHKAFRKRLDDMGILWHQMLPFAPLSGQIRRPDLRNHRKILIIDGREAYVGSHNLVAPDYDTPSYAKAGIVYDDTSVSVTGPIVSQIQAVFAVDWYYACKEVLTPADLTPPTAPQEEQRENPQASAMQIIPSGPAFKGVPNLRAFVHMISTARTHVSITSPYFIPDEALMTALTNAALSGVEVELFVSEQFDQFLVGHAQRSYYGSLLKAGVRIHLYRKPRMLHSKYVIVDGSLCAIGSSNMDVRSFGLNYEITLIADDARLVELLHGNDQRTRERSRELTYEEWCGQPWHVHYVDNICRLGSSLL